MAAQKCVTKMTRGNPRGLVTNTGARGGKPSPEEQKVQAPRELPAAPRVLPRGIWLSSGHLHLAGVSLVSSEPMQRARSKAFAHILQLPQVSSDSFAFPSSLLLRPRGHLNLRGLLLPLWTFFSHFLDLFYVG